MLQPILLHHEAHTREVHKLHTFHCASDFRFDGFTWRIPLTLLLSLPYFIPTVKSTILLETYTVVTCRNSRDALESRLLGFRGAEEPRAPGDAGYLNVSSCLVIALFCMN